MKRILNLLTHRYLALAFRIYIGGLFIYAGIYKINYTGEFAGTVASYRMVPYWGVPAVAVVMPWIELVAGVLMVTGIRVRSACMVIGSLLVMFTIGILVNLLRDSPISCGCFRTIEDPISWWTFFRDSIWVMMTLHVFFFDKALQLEEQYSFKIKEI
jgi:uncharacterized membrane protein YphA (DoxX/SURF4 family)